MGFGANRTSSVPDALAKTLKVHLEDSPTKPRHSDHDRFRLRHGSVSHVRNRRPSSGGRLFLSVKSCGY